VPLLEEVSPPLGGCDPGCHGGMAESGPRGLPMTKKWLALNGGDLAFANRLLSLLKNTRPPGQ
jgi:hypothetical protein